MSSCFQKALFALIAVLSFASFLLILVAMSSQKWVTGKILCKTGAELVNATDPELTKFMGKIYYGLFGGHKMRQCGLGGRPSRFKMFPHLVRKVNTMLHVTIILSLSMAFSFALVSCGFCFLNLLKVPFRAIQGPAGVALWNLVAGGLLCRWKSRPFHVSRSSSSTWMKTKHHQSGPPSQFCPPLREVFQYGSSNWHKRLPVLLLALRGLFTLLAVLLSAALLGCSCLAWGGCTTLAVTAFVAAVKLHRLTERIANFRESGFQFLILEEEYLPSFWLCVASAALQGLNVVFVALSTIRFPTARTKIEEANVTAEGIMY